MTTNDTSRADAHPAAPEQKAQKTPFRIRLRGRQNRITVDSVAKRTKVDGVSRDVRALTPDVLRRQITELEADAARYRATADELDVRVAKLRENLETLERGELPPDELRAKILALANIDGWITIPRVARFYPTVPIHQVERAVGELEREHALVRDGEVDYNTGPGRPAQKYRLAAPGEIPTHTVPARKRRTRETPTA